MTMSALRGLYAVTPEGLPPERLSALVSAALAGGVRLVQYRSKEASADLRRSQAAALLALCRASSAQLVINDDLALALELGADGVHLGRDDGDPAAAREALGPKRILGVSCYGDLAAAEAAAAAGADYLAFGSVFASGTKPQAPVIPLELLGQAKRRFGLPVAAIGGITLDNAARTIAAGADLLAVIADLFDAGDIAAVSARARKYQKLFD
ncbi:thiamine-phosphate synthase [mine drainage metagenome]|uniref:thiamine phosphate synthase n=1 Tax=mine drainage metagenome TaxID=410659 RepID=A0A1J5S2B3_9ZZZZ